MEDWTDVRISVTEKYISFMFHARWLGFTLDTDTPLIFSIQLTTRVEEDIIFLITFSPQALIIPQGLYIMSQHLK